MSELPPDVFNHMQKGDELLGELQEWFNNCRSQMGSTTVDLSPPKTRSQGPKNRTMLFSQVSTNK